MRTIFTMKKLIALFMLTATLLVGQTPVNSSETVYTGAKVTFTATADGTLPISLVWYKDGTPVTANVTTSANQTSYTNDVFTLPSVQLTDAGTYKVVASNIAGTAESNTLAVIVIVPVGPNNVKILIKRG